MRDDGISTVVGAIIVLALLGTAILYVNTVHVPRQGASLEVAGTERTENALLQLTAQLSEEPSTSRVGDIPLRSDRPTPPLMSGIVLTPAQSRGIVAFAPESPNMSVSILTDIPPEGVPADDPIREDTGDGKMRVYLLGNRTALFPTGSLQSRVGGAYLEPVEYTLEGGALVRRSGESSSLVTPPSLSVLQTPETTSVTWILPLLSGPSASVSSHTGAQVALTPGPVAELGGSKVYNVTIRVETTTGDAWRTALRQVVGAAGYVNATLDASGRGIVQADIAPPPTAAPETANVDVRFFAVRYEVGLGERTGG